MRLRDARIGYAGYSRDFAAPGDRRRFCAYAAGRELSVERADVARQYDLVLVSHNGDIPGWTARKLEGGSEFGFVFELADSYFAQTNPVRRWLKGTARYALGTDSRLSPDFLRTLIRACEAADAVICSTEEQRETIRRYNRNVFLSFDYFGNELGPPKEHYRREDKLRIVWEGQSTTLPNLQVIREPLNDLRDKLELHVVTDPRIHRYFGRFSAYPAMDALKGIECDQHFHPWHRSTFSSDITACDVAVIPIRQSNRLWWGKPENKLILLWQLGIPVLTSATAAYRRTMDAAETDMSCATTAEWGAQLEKLIAADPSGLQAIGLHCRAFAERAYSEEEFMRRFDSAFAAIGFTTD